MRTPIQAAWKFLNLLTQATTTRLNFWEGNAVQHGTRMCALCQVTLDDFFENLKTHAMDHWNQLDPAVKAAAMAGEFELAVELELETRHGNEAA